MDEPMKPAEVWAHVKKGSGRVTYVCGLDDSKDSAEAMMMHDERLARVRITEIVEEPKP